MKSNIKVIEIVNKLVWEKYLVSKNPNSFLQSWNWGETQRKVGKKIFRLGFYRNKKLVGVCLLIKERAKRGPHLIVPGGPVIDFEDTELVNEFIAVIKEIVKKEKAWFVRVRPELIENEKSKLLFKSLGFIKSPMHLHAENTWIVDINKDEQEILMSMRKNTRYLIKKTNKTRISVEVQNDDFGIDKLYKLQKETAKRHNFVPFSKALFKAQLDSFVKDKQCDLFICKKADQILAAAIIIYYAKVAYYHHSASSEKARELNASYKLQWEVIKEAKRRGIKKYNMWGIAPENDKKHRFWGVSVFKKGFGGEEVNWLGAQDLPIVSFYYLTYIFELVRKKVRRL